MKKQTYKRGEILTIRTRSGTRNYTVAEHSSHRTKLKGERGAERVLVVGADGSKTLWSYGDKPRSEPVLDVAASDEFVGADVDPGELPMPPKHERSDGLYARAAGLKPIDMSDTRLRDRTRAYEIASGRKVECVGATLSRAAYVPRRPDAAPANPVEREDVRETSFELEVRRETDFVAEMLVRKNTAYGDSALAPIRVFSRASVEDGLAVRMDDKLSRIVRGADAGEDPELDLIGYLVLRRIARRRSSQVHS